MKKTRKGLVVSDKMEKSAVVAIERIFVHPLYEKRLKRKKKYLVHNEVGAKIGDLVEISETRPISKKKKWRITKIISHVTA